VSNNEKPFIITLYFLVVFVFSERVRIIVFISLGGLSRTFLLPELSFGIEHVRRRRPRPLRRRHRQQHACAGVLSITKTSG